jgi:sporulation protein YlmC with PRC-barrel domain
MNVTVARMSGALAIGCLLVAQAVAADTKPADKTDVVARQFRASTIEGMKVVNAAGEDLGKVNDFVIDMNNGHIIYAALEFGGWLGIGDKLFAVPFGAFKYQAGNAKENGHLMLDVAKDRLKTAPGFDKNHWPDMANPEWATPVDQFYGHSKTASAR